MTLTYFEDLDKAIGELSPGEIVVVGARPSMGKTALALSIAANNLNNGKKCLFISLEERKERVFWKLASHFVDIAPEKLPFNIDDDKGMQRKGITGFEAQRFTALKGSLLKYDDSFYQAGYENLAYWGRQALAFFNETCKDYREKEIDLIVIDYLQLLEIDGRDHKKKQEKPQKTDSLDRTREIAKILNHIKEFAHAMNAPVWLNSQLSRNVEERAGHLPILTDLRDCGCIEEVADKVLFLVRPEYYDPLNRPALCDVIIAKNRQGKEGNVNLQFNKEIAAFEDFIPASMGCDI